MIHWYFESMHTMHHAFLRCWTHYWYIHRVIFFCFSVTLFASLFSLLYHELALVINCKQEHTTIEQGIRSNVSCVCVCGVRSTAFYCSKTKEVHSFYGSVSKQHWSVVCGLFLCVRLCFFLCKRDRPKFVYAKMNTLNIICISLHRLCAA